MAVLNKICVRVMSLIDTSTVSVNARAKSQKRKVDAGDQVDGKGRDVELG